MGGSSSAVLKGWSTPVSLTKWDHTYVASDCGWVWRCWGAHTGGQTVASATGSSFLANCLSKPFGTAEVMYGINGVCHQTANRILLPATGAKVLAARGYNLSFKTYGHYGRPWLPGWAAWQRRLAACTSSAATSSSHAVYVGVDRQRVFKKDWAMTDDSRHSTNREGSNGPTLDQLLGYMEDGGEAVEMVRQMCNPHLEQPLSYEEEVALVAEQERFETQQTAYVAALQANEIGREAYLKAMNDLLARSMARYADVLGEARFLLVFGEAGYEPDKLIDRETFLGER